MKDLESENKMKTIIKELLKFGVVFALWTPLFLYLHVGLYALGTAWICMYSSWTRNNFFSYLFTVEVFCAQNACK